MNELIKKTIYKEIRDNLMEEFRNVPYEGGERLKLDPSLLEKVIFEKDPRSNRKIITLPGEVLAHIDLSEVSFYGVSLIRDKEHYLDLSRTNASFVYGRDGGCFVHYCNLSNGLIQLKNGFQDSFFGFENCCLAGIDLSDCSIGISEFFEKFKNVNLAKTGIFINSDDISIKNLSVSDTKKLRNLIRKGYLVDCYLDCHRLFSDEARKQKKEQIQNEYADLRVETVDVVAELTATYKKNKGYVKTKQ